MVVTDVEAKQDLATGLTTISSGEFQPSSDIVRVLVNYVCIENLVFEVT
jgi:phenylpyruvate tautomerase PptA (4-oxalocrotonate tautomerase family)